jgi:hypothetical protein
MIVISAGMPKSGSAYFYNILNELEYAAGNADARQIKAKYHIDHLMKWHNNNIGALSFKKLFKLWQISLKDGAFVVKTHAPPSWSAKVMNKLGLIRIVYCYRDPRDALISAVDHGKQILNRGENHRFTKMVEFDTALRKVKTWLEIWKDYSDMSGVYMLKYENLIHKQIEVVKAVEDFLDIYIDDGKREEILWKYSKDNTQGERIGMHFNVAKTGRFRYEMTKEQKIKCQMAFGEYLEKMAYSVE